MITELTSEQIVTNLLSSHEILKPQKENFYTTMPQNLGDFLNNLPQEEVNNQYIDIAGNKKYSFIKECNWSWK